MQCHARGAWSGRRRAPRQPGADPIQAGPLRRCRPGHGLLRGGAAPVLARGAVARPGLRGSVRYAARRRRCPLCSRSECVLASRSLKAFGCAPLIGHGSGPRSGAYPGWTRSGDPICRLIGRSVTGKAVTRGAGRMLRGCLAHSDELGPPGWGDGLVGPGQAEGTPSPARAVCSANRPISAIGLCRRTPGKGSFGGQSAGHFGPALVMDDEGGIIRTGKGRTVQVPAPRHGCDQPEPRITALMPGSR